MGLESDGHLHYRPSTGTLTATEVSVTTLDIGGTNVTSTATELNIMDGNSSTSTGVTVVDADNLIINDAGTGGTMKQVAVTALKTYISSNAYPFVLAELDASQQTSTTETAIGLNTTALVSLGGIFSINGSDYIETSEAGYFEVTANVTWDKDSNNDDYLMVQIQKYTSSSWSNVPGGKFLVGAPSSTPDYTFGSGSTIVQLAANDRIRVTVDQSASDTGLYLRSTGVSSSEPGDTTIMVKKIGG